MMMRMMIKKAALFLFLLSSYCLSYSRNDDFGIWYNASGEIKIMKRLDLEITGCVRTFKNASKVDELFVEAGLGYKLNKYIAVGGAYRFGEFFEDDDSYHPRHKWFADVTGKLPIGDLKISGRFRFQQRFKTYFEDEEDKIPVSHARIKVKAFYNISSFPVNPYVSTEVFCPMFTGAERNIDKNRFMLGLEYNISKKHSIDIEYMFQRDFLPHIKDINIISVEYKINL